MSVEPGGQTPDGIGVGVSVLGGRVGNRVGSGVGTNVGRVETGAVDGLRVSAGAVGAPLVGAAVVGSCIGAELVAAWTSDIGDGVAGLEVGACVGGLVSSSVGFLVVGVPYVGSASVGVGVVGEAVVGAGPVGTAVASHPPQSWIRGVPLQMLSVPASKHVADDLPRTVHHTPWQPVGDALGRFVCSQLAHDGDLEGSRVGGDGGTAVVGGRARAAVGGAMMSCAAKTPPQVIWIDTIDPNTAHAWPISATSASPQLSRFA